MTDTTNHDDLSSISFTPNEQGLGAIKAALPTIVGNIAYFYKVLHETFEPKGVEFHSPLRMGINTHYDILGNAEAMGIWIATSLHNPKFALPEKLVTPLGYLYDTFSGYIKWDPNAFLLGDGQETIAQSEFGRKLGLVPIAGVSLQYPGSPHEPRQLYSITLGADRKLLPSIEANEYFMLRAHGAPGDIDARFRGLADTAVEIMKQGRYAGKIKATRQNIAIAGREPNI